VLGPPGKVGSPTRPDTRSHDISALAQNAYGGLGLTDEIDVGGPTT
jgi:hypothetical protein